MSCFYCKGDVMPSTTVFSIELDNCLVVVRNVPCLECSQCGEVEIEDDVMERLEHIIDAARSLIQEVAVVDYRLAA